MPFTSAKPKASKFSLDFQMNNQAVPLSMELRRAGKSDQQIALELQTQGFSPEEIEDATGVDVSLLPGGPAGPPQTPTRISSMPKSPAAMPPPLPVSYDDPAAAFPAVAYDDGGDLYDDPMDVEGDPYGMPAGGVPRGTAQAPGNLLDEVPAGASGAGTLLPGEAGMLLPGEPGGIAPEQSTIAKLMGFFSPESDSGQAIMAAGLGMLGAQGTYGSTAGAIGQGGIVGLNAYQGAQRTRQINDLRQQQIEASREAAREAKLQSRLKTLQTLAADNPDAANVMLARDTELQEYIPMLPGGTFRGDPGKPSIITNERSGNVFAVDSVSGTVTPIGNIGAQPPVSAGGETGQFTRDVVNPETGLAETWRFDRNGNPIRKLGIAPQSGSGLSVQMDPETGRVIGISQGQKVPSVVEANAYRSIDAAETLERMVDNLDAALDQSKVGLVGDIGQMTMGALAQVRGLPLPRAVQNMVSDVIATARGNGEKIDEKTLLDPNTPVVRVLSVTVPRLYAKMLDPGGKLSDADSRDAMRALGFDNPLANVDDIRGRLRMVKALATQQREQAQRHLKSASGGVSGLPGAPRAGGERETAVSPEEQRFNALVASGMSEDEAYAEMARQ